MVVRELNFEIERREVCEKAAAGPALNNDSELKLAESEGFEPPIRFPVCRFSRPVPSTTRPTLPDVYFLIIFGCSPLP